MTVQPQRLMETQPVNQQSTSKINPGNPRNNLVNTEKVTLKPQDGISLAYFLVVNKVIIIDAANNQLGANTMNFNMTTSTQNLRPTSQQK